MDHQIVSFLYYAGNENDFVPGAFLIFRAGLVMGDYHGQNEWHKFEKWLMEKLFPHFGLTALLCLIMSP
jgi:hypothetical protein